MAIEKGRDGAGGKQQKRTDFGRHGGVDGQQRESRSDGERSSSKDGWNGHGRKRTDAEKSGPGIGHDAEDRKEESHANRVREKRKVAGGRKELTQQSKEVTPDEEGPGLDGSEGPLGRKQKYGIRGSTPWDTVTGTPERVVQTSGGLARP